MARVLQALNEHGPSHAVELADKLGVRDIRASEAVASLDRLGLVTRDRGGPRVIYRARTPNPWPTLPRGMPTRVWQHLATFGPSCAPALVNDLGVRKSPVSGALKRLQRCGRAEPAGRAPKLNGTRAPAALLYAALDEHGNRVEPEVDMREREPRAHERHGDGRYSVFDLDVALSRAADPDVEIEALMIGNRPIV